jgi:hypothetical protein
MSSATPGLGPKSNKAPEPIGSVTITLYALKAGQAQVQIAFPNGTRSRQPDLTAKRAELRQLIHGEIDRAFNAFGDR